MVGFDQPPIAQLVYDTEKCQYTQRSDKRRQLGQIVKRRNKPQPSNPHEQHQNTLPTRQSRIIPAIADTRRINIHLFRQLAGNQISGNSHGYNGRQEHGTRKLDGVTAPLTHSIKVDTSPITVRQPPALAAITITAP